MKPGKLTVEWSGSYRVEFDAESVACDLDDAATDDAIRAAIETDAVKIADEQSHAAGWVRGITDDHIAAVRAALKERSGE